MWLRAEGEGVVVVKAASGVVVELFSGWFCGNPVQHPD
jgi:hypothetical protein